MRRLLLALVLSIAPLALAQNTARLVAGTQSRLVLEGSSNIAPWRCSGATLDGTMEVAAPLERIEAMLSGVETFTLRVPIATLRCGNRQMERDMVRALRADAYPTIEFALTRIGGRFESEGTCVKARIDGVLKLAGVQRAVSFDVEAERISNGRFQLRARLPLRMTDFRVTPPTALFGMIKADDRLAVQFDLVLEKQP